MVVTGHRPGIAGGGWHEMDEEEEGGCTIERLQPPGGALSSSGQIKSSSQTSSKSNPDTCGADVDTSLKYVTN